MKLTHPNKIIYAEDKISKSEIAEYYASVQKLILPYLNNRLLTLLRCPDDYQHCFYQKHLSHQIPQGIHEILVKEKEGKDKYLYINNEEGLFALSQLGVLELHPWGSRIDHLEHPDMLIFDLDPSPEVPWKKVKDAAFEIKAILENFKLQSFVKSTGGKGLHVIIPIKPEYDWDEVSHFAQSFVMTLVMNNSQAYVGKMTKSARKNKIFIDYLRNKRGATAIAPYSIRARKHAPVAAPLAWDELTNNRRDTIFTIKTLKNRLAKMKQDPWKDFFKIRQSLNLDQFKNK